MFSYRDQTRRKSKERKDERDFAFVEYQRLNSNNVDEFDRHDSNVSKRFWSLFDEYHRELRVFPLEQLDVRNQTRK